MRRDHWKDATRRLMRESLADAAGAVKDARTPQSLSVALRGLLVRLDESHIAWMA